MLQKLFNKNKPNIMIFGDIMLDINISGNVNKIANEGPIPILLKNNISYNLGGCGNVLMNLESFGCNNLYLMSIVGNDQYNLIINNILDKTNIINFSYIDNIRKTTVKNRFFNNKHLMFRYDEEDTYNITHDIEDYFILKLKENISNIDTLIISDYNKGICTERLCKKLIKICNNNNVFIIVDPKNDYYKYSNATIIKPNRTEASSFINKNITKSNILECHIEFKKKINCKYSIITLAEEGLSLYNDNHIFSSNLESVDVIDVTGAGDIVCAVVGYLINITDDLNVIIQMANYLATTSVKHSGVYIITKNDMLNLKLFINSSKIISFNDLDIIDKSKKIVFTNGCFDLIHNAHLKCLQYAKKQGDILIVGLNSDNSIKKIKGDNRPIQNEETRLNIISSLYYVDYVILFNDDTPYEIIKQLKPDVLVKGGDYNIDTIVGKEFVKDIRLFNYINNISTTNIINNILLNKF